MFSRPIICCPSDAAAKLSLWKMGANTSLQSEEGNNLVLTEVGRHCQGHIDLFISPQVTCTLKYNLW